MNPKIVLTVIGVLTALHGILWTFFFTNQEMIPGLSAQGMLVLNNMSIIVGCFNFPIATILLFCRDLEITSAKRLLTGTGVGFLFILALTIRNGIIMADDLGPLATPLPVIIIWALVSAWLLYTGLKKDYKETEWYDT